LAVAPPLLRTPTPPSSSGGGPSLPSSSHCRGHCRGIVTHSPFRDITSVTFPHHVFRLCARRTEDDDSATKTNARRVSGTTSIPHLLEPATCGREGLARLDRCVLGMVISHLGGSVLQLKIIFFLLQRRFGTLETELVAWYADQMDKLSSFRVVVLSPVPKWTR
jgi:hypothetical protein